MSRATQPAHGVGLPHASVVTASTRTENASANRRNRTAARSVMAPTSHDDDQDDDNDDLV